MTVYNFGAGPAMLPQSVREKIKEEWLDWQGLGISVAEISHRSEQYHEFFQTFEKNFRSLLEVPDDYTLLFLQGGGQGQFGLVPLNLLGKNNQADYLIYGLWSERAFNEAERYGDIKLIQLTDNKEPITLISDVTAELRDDVAYVHCCTNETVDGIRMRQLPQTEAPLVADMSSDLLAAPLDVSRFGVIYACAQKNFGIAGITAVLVRNDLLDQSMSFIPSVFNYKKQAEQHSFYNTIPTFACYVSSLVVDWVVEQGGLTAMAERNQRQAELLYQLIDNSNDFYHNKVAAKYRSLMNVTFYLANEELQRQFLLEAEQQGLLFLKGHSTRGGLRASIYNAMPDEGVQLLADFMQDFAQRKG